MEDPKIKAWIFEEIHKTNCPQCQNSLKTRWLSEEEKNKLIFEVSDPQFDPELRNGSELTQVEYCFCSKCNWQKPTLLVKDTYEDISPTEENKYQKERELIEKITNCLLPNHSFKIRFITNREYRGITLPIDELNRRTYAVCFTIEYLLELEKEDSGIFMDVVAHELAHAEVFKNPQYDFKNAYYCSCKVKKGILERVHKGEGHDKIWHDKYDEFRERIKNEELAVGSDYQALGKDFVLNEYKNSNNEPKRDSNSSSTKPTNKEIFWWIGGGIIFLLSISFLIYLFRRRRTVKKSRV